MKKNNVLARVFSAKNLKRICVSCTLLLGVSSVAPLCAQEDSNWSMTVGADAVSHYLWRGMESAGPSVQPSAYFDYEKGDWALSMGTWASKSFIKGDYNEFDLSLEATWKNITLSLASYSEFYGPKYGGSNLDLGLSWTISEDIPVSFSWYSIMTQTAEASMDGGGIDWKSAFPSYFEIAYEFSLSVVDFSVAAGMLPFASDYYGNDGLGLCNLNLGVGHEFEFEHGGTLPISAQVMYNPMWNDFFWSVGVGYYFSLDF